jgi:hypothetical protein
VLAAGVLILYLGILRGEADEPPPWVLALFAVGIGAAVAAAGRGSRTAVLVGLVALGPLALVSLRSIGLLLVPSVVLLGISYAAGRGTGEAPAS